MFYEKLINKFLLNSYKKKYMKLIDINFSKLFYLKNDKNSYIYMLFASILSLYNRLGNMYLFLDNFFINNIYLSEYILNFLYYFFKNFISIENCVNLMLNSNIISLWFNKRCTPFILYNDCIYLYKNWYYENYIVKYLNNNIYLKISNNLNLKNLYFYFNEFNINLNLKKIILSSIYNKFTIISGSAGTGKSTLIIKLIILLYKLFDYKNNKNIILLSPTGKLSSWLTNNLNNIYDILNINKKFKSILPNKCFTIHKFLGFNYLYNYIKYNKNNKILSNYIIIDECSMISINIFYNLLSSLNSYTKLILIGDYNQLGSINSISIFNEICNSIFNKFYMKNNFNYFIYYKNIFILNKNYRYINNNKNIGIFLNIIKNKNFDLLNKYLFDNFLSNIKFYDSKKLDYNAFINLCIKFYKNYIEFIIEDFIKIDKLLEIFKINQIICVLKHSDYGINIINELINKYICSITKSSNLYYSNNRIYFIGEPILVTKNNNDLKLYNGDLGFFIIDKNKKLRLYFNKLCYYLHPFMLYNWINSWCITVHKSQGSEYNNILFVLPNKYIDILNYNLIYTALSRAKKKIIIYGNIDILINSLKININKNTNIIKRLKI